MTKDNDDASPGGLSLRQTLQIHEERLMDFDRNICLLCKRKFKNGDQIKRHRLLSKLHSFRIKRLRQRVFNDDQLDMIEKKEREILYRDRAKERRSKYGKADRVIPHEHHHKLTKESRFRIPTRVSVDANESCAKSKLLDNKGAALLTKMGWSEGAGLGRNDEGRTETIKLDAHVGRSGLGSSKSYRVDPSLSYKDAVKQIMYQRYHDLSSDEDT